jgi:hypothetical protein
MPSGDTRYQARFETPEFLERGRNNPIECRVYSAGALVAPTSGTVSVYNAAGEAVVNAQTVTIASSKATYTVSSSALTDRPFEAGWRVEWTLVLSSVTHVFRTEAMLCRRILYPPVTQADLLRRHQDLANLRESARSSYEDEIDEAWVGIQNDLVAQGNRPNLITTPAALREHMLHRVLALVYANFWHGTREDDYLKLHEHHSGAAKESWAALVFGYDRDEDGLADSESSRKGHPVTVLSSRKPRWGWA